MALPSLSTPEFVTKIPSTGEEIKYRPFLVKEEKILLMALEGKDQVEITDAVMRLLENCIITKIDIKKLATFDVEYLFLKLRGKSVGENIEIRAMHQTGDCKETTNISINLDKIEISGERTDGKIMLTDDVGVKLKYPGMRDIIGIDLENSSSIFKLVSKCIEYVFNKNEVFNEFTEKEIIEWIEGLNQAQFKKITEFFTSIPKLSHTVKWKCKKCNKDDEFKLEGLQSFFT
jgi:hypothetical protein